MAHREGQPATASRKTSVSRAASRRKRGKAVTIEDDVDDYYRLYSGGEAMSMAENCEGRPEEWFQPRKDAAAPAPVPPPTSAAADPPASAPKPSPSSATKRTPAPAPAPVESSTTETSNSEESSEETDPVKSPVVSKGRPAAHNPNATSSLAKEATQALNPELPSHTPGIISPPNPELPTAAPAERKDEGDAAIPEKTQPPMDKALPPMSPGQARAQPWSAIPDRAASSSPRVAHPYGLPSAPQPPLTFGHPPPQIPPFQMYPMHPMPGVPPPPGMQLARVRQTKSGYDVLAASLSGSLQNQPALPGLYRRFKELNHRVLLGHQDQLSWLEEQLSMLDQADSEARNTGNGFVPDALRRERTGTKERRQLMEQISNHLYRYNQEMHAFYKLLDDVRDSVPGDIEAYRRFLSKTSAVVPIETQFLERSTDLLCLPDGPYYDSESGNATPVAHATRYIEAAAAPADGAPGIVGLDQVTDRFAARTPVLRRPKPLDATAVRGMIAGIAAATILPIMTFPLIPVFVGRIAVVLLMAVFTLVLAFAFGMHETLGTTAGVVEIGIGLGVYAAVMTVVAGTTG